MSSFKLYMMLLGCKLAKRHTEQHDIFFTVSDDLRNTVADIKAFWPEAKEKIHIDAWRVVTNIDGFSVTIISKNEIAEVAESDPAYKLFFINLGGYKQNEFEEFHYKMLIVARNKEAAIQHAKQSAFYKHTGFESAGAHIDDKYGVDVDDMYEIEDILPHNIKKQFSIVVASSSTTISEDEINLGYFRLDKL